MSPHGDRGCVDRGATPPALSVPRAASALGAPLPHPARTSETVAGASPGDAAIAIDLVVLTTLRRRSRDGRGGARSCAAFRAARELRVGRPGRAFAAATIAATPRRQSRSWLPRRSPSTPRV